MAREDEAYLRWVRTQRCRAPGAPAGCAGAVEAHHAGRHGVGQRAHDRTAVPLCRAHHRAWHDARGPFEGWTANQRRGWAIEVVAATAQAHAFKPPPLPDWF